MGRWPDFKNFQARPRVAGASSGGQYVQAVHVRYGDVERLGPAELPTRRPASTCPLVNPIGAPEHDAKYGGMVTHQYAMANSMNTIITAWLMKQYSPQAVTVLAAHGCERARWSRCRRISLA